MHRSEDDGGFKISDYKLEIGEGTTPSSFTEIESYEFLTNKFAFELDGSSLTAGQLYSFRFSAFNQLGWSEPSDLLIVALGPLPGQPSAPVKMDSALNSASVIKLGWSLLDSQLLEVSSYRLYMDDGFGVDFQVVLDQNTNEHLVENLTPGISYSFKLTAINFNGESAPSTAVVIKSCVKPSRVRAPTLVRTTATSAELRWEMADDNGCPIESYSVLSDLASGSEFVNNLDAIDVENNPYKFSHVFNFDSSLTGKTLRFKLKAANEIGSTESDDYLQVLLASVPYAPSAAVEEVLSKKNSLVVFMPIVAQNQGSTLTEYQLWADDGL